MLSRVSAAVGSSTSGACLRDSIASFSASRTKWRPILPGLSDCQDQNIFMNTPVAGGGDRVELRKNMQRQATPAFSLRSGRYLRGAAADLSGQLPNVG